MGVKGLQYYVENRCPSGVKPVSIVALANAHRQAYNCVPVLAVDGMSVLHRLYKMDDLEWLYGGQWKQYVENFNLFVQRFRDEGIELIFFFDGVVEVGKTREWIDRRIEKLKDIRKIFDNLVHYNTYPENLSQLPASMATLIRYALLDVCKCEVVNSIIDADKEIARFAVTSRSCFAILSQDSDYMIFNTKPYLSVSHLKLGPLETVVYDRVVLASHIGLTVEQLPLLACLLGNDYVHVDSVRAFHRFLCASKGYTNAEMVIPKLAQYIRSSGWKRGIAHQSDIINEIATNVGLAPENIFRGLRYYYIEVDEPDPEPAAKHLFEPALLETFKNRHRIGKMNPQIYNVLCMLSNKSSECLEDQKTTGLLPASIIFRRLRQRMYALLFGTQDVEVEELSAIQGVPVLMEKVKPELFQTYGAQPRIRHLWYNSLFSIRWRTVIQAMGLHVSEVHMTGAQPQFAAFACLINYLLLNPIGEPKLAPWEVDAMIAQAVSPLANDLGAIRKLQIPVVDARAVHLATILLRGLTTMVSLIQVCADPLPVAKIMPWHFFDGKLFHYLYLMAKAGASMEELVLNDRKAVKDFIQLRIMSLTGTYIQKERYGR